MRTNHSQALALESPLDSLNYAQVDDDPSHVRQSHADHSEVRQGQTSQQLVPLARRFSALHLGNWPPGSRC